MTNANEALRKVATENVTNRKVPAQPHQPDTSPATVEYNPQIRWPDLGAQLFLHGGAVYGLVFLLYKIKLLTFVWCKYGRRQVHLTMAIAFWHYPVSASEVGLHIE